jgi:hypothetical protein
MQDDKLPIGIQNNNPGNLRQAYGMKYPTTLKGGYAYFPSLCDGVEALSKLTYDYYVSHGLRTLPKFIERYAPATENDVLAYVRNMVLILNINPLRVDTQSIDISDPWRAMIFMRALIRCECGAKPAGETTSGDWVPISTFATAMNRAARWGAI